MKVLNWMGIGLVSVFVGCSDADIAQDAAAPNQSTANSQFVASTEPADAVPVGAARESAEDQQDVTVIGTIGGSSEPFVDGLAAFTIVDPKVPYCSPDEGCPTPWDYCCTQDQVRNNIATVKVVDESGNPVTSDARELLGVKELSSVVVQGKATRDEQGNLTVAATRVFVRPNE